MTSASAAYAALARAISPPGGDPRAFPALGLPQPEAASLASEHVALFGRAGRSVLSPYEGTHRGTSLGAVLAAYACAGVEPDPTFRDRADHAGVQLAVLSVLARRGEARAFFRERIAPWMPAFFERMSREERFPAHRALAVPALRLLEVDGARYHVTRAATRPRRAVPTPLCTGCGKPLGIVPPTGGPPRPAWGALCVRCRVGADLRRSTP